MRWPLVAVLGSLALYAALALSVGGGPLGWDSTVADTVADAAPVPSTDVHVDPYMEAVTFAVGGLTLAVGAWLVVRRRLRAALFLGAAIGGAVALSTLAKGLVERPPIEGPADEFTFPSGSAAWSMATAVAIALLLRSRRELPAVAGAGAALVLGLATVIVWEEWHYPSDVVAGWCIGLGWTTALWLALGRPSAPPTHPGWAVDDPGPGARYSGSKEEEQPAAAPSVPAARDSGGTDSVA